MNAMNYWQLFLETGAPEMYLMYTQMRKQEAKNVLESTGLGDASHTIQ